MKYAKLSQTTNTYQVEDGFELIITRCANGAELWLTHTSIGIAECLFGTGEPLTDEDMIDLFDANAEEYMTTFYILHDEDF